MPYTYDYPHPAVSVDIVIFTVRDRKLEVLLIRRGAEPFAGQWALPGGFVEIDESLKHAAWRELKEETGVNAAWLEQLHAFGNPQRDPRERVISVAYYSLIPAARLDVRADSDAAEARWFAADEPPSLAFDHDRILARARRRVADKARDPLYALRLVPETFTLPELTEVYECLAGQPADRRNFRKRVIASGRVSLTGETRQTGPHRPAKVYRHLDRAGRGPTTIDRSDPD